MTTVTVSGFKIRKGERLYGTYVRYALYKATVRSEAKYKMSFSQRSEVDYSQNDAKRIKYDWCVVSG